LQVPVTKSLDLRIKRIHHLVSSQSKWWVGIMFFVYCAIVIVLLRGGF